MSSVHQAQGLQFFYLDYNSRSIFPSPPKMPGLLLWNKWTVLWGNIWKFTHLEMGVSAPVKAGIRKGLQSHSRSSLYDEDLGEENKAPMLVVQAQGGGRKRPWGKSSSISDWMGWRHWVVKYHSETASRKCWIFISLAIRTRRKGFENKQAAGWGVGEMEGERDGRAAMVKERTQKGRLESSDLQNGDFSACVNGEWGRNDAGFSMALPWKPRKILESSSSQEIELQGMSVKQRLFWCRKPKINGEQWQVGVQGRGTPEDTGNQSVICNEYEEIYEHR